MTTKDYIRKINDLAQEATRLNERHETGISLFTPKWMKAVPLNEFIELCDTFEHDPVKVNGWPQTWLRVGGIQISIWGADKVPEQPAPPPIPSALDYLRELTNHPPTTKP